MCDNPEEILSDPCYYCEAQSDRIHLLDKYAGDEPSNCVPICDYCHYISTAFHASYLASKPKVEYRQNNYLPFTEKWTTYYSKFRSPLKVYSNSYISFAIL